MSSHHYGTLFAILWLFAVGALFQQAHADETIPYHVEIHGIDDQTLKESLLSYSTAAQKQDSPPASLFALKARAKKDLPVFQKLLRSKAYFNPKIIVESEKQEEDTALIFRFQLRERYLLEKVAFGVDGDTLPKPDLKRLGLKLEQPALTTSILDAEQALLEYAKEHSYAFAKLCPKKVVVNHDSKSVSVDFCLDAGEKIRLGTVSFEGNDNVDAGFLEALIQWEQDVPYIQKELDAKRLKLVDSRLFTIAHMDICETADENGLHPVTFQLTERPPRTVGVGLRLTTDEELFLVRGEWENRNLWRHGEALEAELNISLIESSLEGSFRKPVFYAPENTFVADVAFISEDSDAYESLRGEFSATIEHQFTKKMRINGGLAYRFSRVTETDGVEEDFNLVSLPVRFTWNFSDNFLEPTSGGRLWVDEQPFYDLGSGATFYRQKIRYNHYLSLTDDDDLILAGRVILGNIFGANVSAVPADLRYFTGGGDTIRGYEYQSVSPKDTDGDPMGGLSMLALSAELRAWVTDSIGIVAFIDAGRAYENKYQDFSEPLQIGVGLGLRYKTPIGSLRLDLARPVNKRNEDDDYQVYISIGHTF